MARVQLHAGLDLAEPYLVEGLPGAGLVGKIAADHLVETLEMERVGAVHCEGLPDVAVYQPDETTVVSPVRLYADRERDFLVLQSDVPVSPSTASDFAECVTTWLYDNAVTPIYLSGLGEEKEDVPEVYGVATGGAADALERADVRAPRDGGLVTGPTGALLHRAGVEDIDAVGLIVECDARFPDPEAARRLLTAGIEPIAGVDVATDQLVEHAEDIRHAREKLAERMRDADEESTEAQPIKGFQ